MFHGAAYYVDRILQRTRAGGTAHPAAGGKVELALNLNKRSKTWG